MEIQTPSEVTSQGPAKEKDNSVSLQVQNRFDLALLQLRLCELQKSEVILQELLSQALASSDWDLYLKVIPLLLRIYAEQNRHDDIKKVKEDLSDLVIRKGLSVNEACFYALGACAAYRQQIIEAQDYLLQGLEKSKNAKNHEIYAKTLNLLALCSLHLQIHDQAQARDAELMEFLKKHEDEPRDQEWVFDLKVASKLFQALLARNQGKFDLALNVYEEVRELFPQRPSVYSFANLLYGMGTCYVALSKRTEAVFCFQTAYAMIKGRQLVNLQEQILKKLKELNVTEQHEADLLIDEDAGHLVTEKERGRIDFKNQFLLFELLRFLANEPGKTQSKEEIIAKVWGQEYDPQVHDNKLYVTIKRLRKLVEPDFDKPSYILRRKGGYCLSANKHVVIKPAAKGYHS